MIKGMTPAILVGATAFSMVFTYSGGDTMVEEFIHNLPAKEMSFILISMGIILILGFYTDLDNDKRYDAFVNVGGLDGLRGNAFKVEQTETKRRC
jgi:NAD kinase